MSTIFPKWSNRLPPVLALGSVGGLVMVVGLVWYYFTPKFWEVGYQPIQPGTKETWVGFSHQIHAGKLALDCRYCHTHVEQSPEANVPEVATCMNCHTEGRLNGDLEQVIGPRVQFVRDAYAKDQSIPWRRVHKLPDYVRNFPHNIHVNAGVSCYTCHGMIPSMQIVHQTQPLSMGWCLNCHRTTKTNVMVDNLVPRDKVTDLFWVENQLAQKGNPPQSDTPGGEALMKNLKKNNLRLMPDNCGACHY